MAQESQTITTKKTIEAVIDQLQELLDEQIGQTSVSKNGKIHINPKNKYKSFLSTPTSMEGMVRQKRDGQYAVELDYNTKATPMCWVIGIVGGLLMLIPVAVFIVPFYVARNALRDDLQRALKEVQDQLE